MLTTDWPKMYSQDTMAKPFTTAAGESTPSGSIEKERKTFPANRNANHEKTSSFRPRSSADARCGHSARQSPRRHDLRQRRRREIPHQLRWCRRRWAGGNLQRRNLHRAQVLWQRREQPPGRALRVARLGRGNLLRCLPLLPSDRAARRRRGEPVDDPRIAGRQHHAAERCEQWHAEPHRARNARQGHLLGRFNSDRSLRQYRSRRTGSADRLAQQRLRQR